MLLYQQDIYYTVTWLILTCFHSCLSIKNLYKTTKHVLPTSVNLQTFELSFCYLSLSISCAIISKLGEFVWWITRSENLLQPPKMPMMCNNIMSHIVMLHNAIWRTNFFHYALHFSQCSLSFGLIIMWCNISAPYDVNKIYEVQHDTLQRW